MIIDLHGLTEVEAILKLDAFLNDFEQSGADTATVVTGNGIVLKDLAIETIQKSGYNWEHEKGNPGALVIYK